MAYIGHEFYYDGTRATFWGYIQVGMINMGWELHDDISSTVKVYKSNGESGNEPYGYIWIDAGTSTYIEFKAYQIWDNVAHVGARGRYAYNSATYSRLAVTYFSATRPGIISGNKNYVFITNWIGWAGAACSITFGHLISQPGRVVVNAHGTAGTAGTLTVASTSGLCAGRSIQIIGTDGYCSQADVSAVIDSSTIIVNKLEANFTTGSVIGTPASVFGIHSGYGDTDGFYPCCAIGDIGAGTSAAVLDIGMSSGPAMSGYLFYAEGKYLLSPLIVWSNLSTAPGGILGYVDIIRSGKLTADLDVMIDNSDGGFSTAGTASSSGTDKLIDSSKTWSADELAGKYCLLVSGTGIGGIKKITGNDATSFVADSNWYTAPVSGTTYKIADIVRRGIFNLFNNPGYILLTSTIPPA